MIKSMTGFGRCEVAEAERKFTVEMKGVNHRYLDVSIRMPRKLNCFEPAIRSQIKRYVKRGKVDVFVTYEDTSAAEASLKYNEALAGEYIEAFRKMQETFALEYDMRVSTLARCPEVLTMEDRPLDEEELRGGLERAVDGACRQFVAARTTEGENLRADLLDKLDDMYRLVDEVEKRSPQIVAQYREKLEEKLAEVMQSVQVDDSRVAAEVVLFADKICTDEETVRLRIHIDHMKETLGLEGDIGRKLDFIAQEMNREANTILSKANDIETSNLAIDLKTEIEKVREQIQNIE